MNRSNCFTRFCDLVCILFSVTALSWCATTFLSQGFGERSTATSASGFHLLSCPKLFEKADEVDDFQDKYTDIQLSKKSTEKLMDMLKASLQHAHVFHAGGEYVPRSHRSISDAVEGQIGEGKQIDINVPRKADNRHLCEILKSILDEQEEESEDSEPSDVKQHVTISIMKLETEEKESIFLRGARLVRNSPIVGSAMMKITNLDDSLRTLLNSAKEVGIGKIAGDAVKIA